MSKMWDSYQLWLGVSASMQNEREQKRLRRNFRRRCVAKRKVLFEKIKK